MKICTLIFQNVLLIIMKLSKEQINELKQKVSIIEVAEALGILVNQNRARCIRPEAHSHGDRTPSMGFSPDKNTFTCWVCSDVGGDVIALIQQSQELGFVDALRWLSEFSGGVTNLPLGKFNHHGNFSSVSISNSQSVSKISKSKSSIKNSPAKQAPGTFIPPKGSEAWLNRRAVLVLHFLRLCAPVDAEARSYLNKRKIFQKTIDGQGLRWVKDYQKVSQQMKLQFTMQELQEFGFFNDNCHLRYFKHSLILPYLEMNGRPVYFQARAIDYETSPKELNLKGPIPTVYNRRILDLLPGVIYLCEGVIDTLTLIEKGFDAVGVPGVKSFRDSWIPMFYNKKVYLAFDNDAAGRVAAKEIIDLLKLNNVYASQVELPEGMDINSWFSGRK